MGVFDNLFKKKGNPEKMNILGKEVEINADAMVFSQRGLDNYQRQNYSDAVTDFTKAINAQPSNQNFYTMRGTAYEDMGNDIEAAKDFSKTLELHPEDFVAAYRLGMVYFRKKDFENAVKWLKVAFDNSPDVDISHIGIGNNNILFIHKKIISGNLGNFLIQLKRFEEGFKYLDEAIQIDSQYANPYMVKGMAYAQMGKPKEGIPYLKKAMQLGNPQAGMALKMLEQTVQDVDDSESEALELDFVFHSSDHLRYENGRHVSGPHGGAPRAIKVEANISGNEGYTVTIFNTDGGRAVVQMAPKQMKLVSADNQKIVLRGFGHDAMGTSFADYGLSIFHSGTEPTKLKLHMYDRNVDIEYFKSIEKIKTEPEVVELAKQAVVQYQNENPSGARNFLVQIYRSVKSNPEQLNEVSDFENLGKAFLFMLDQNLSDDIDTLQMIVSVGYLCISKAIEMDKQNLNLYKDRLLLLRIGHTPFKYTVMSALNQNAGGIMSFSMGHSDLQARDAIYKMEITDIELNPILYQQVDFFRERRNEFDQMIAREFFLPEKTKENIIKTGINNHNQLLQYLENKILNESDIDF